MAELYRRPDDETSERVLFDFELKKARNSPIGDGSE